MEKGFTKHALLTGLSIFVFLSILILVKELSFILLVIYFIPGALFGILVSSNCINKSYISKFLFFIASTIIYFLSALIFNVRENSTLTFIISSAVGAFLLSIAFTFILNSKKFSIKENILIPVCIGIIASIPSAICFFLIEFIKIEGDPGRYILCGTFLIFPIWQYLMSLNLRNSVKVENKLVPDKDTQKK